jgi:hypothetical protein
VEDGGLGRNFRCVTSILFGAEACQVRHRISVRLRSGGGNERGSEPGLDDLAVRVWCLGVPLKSARSGRLALPVPDWGPFRTGPCALGSGKLLSAWRPKGFRFKFRGASGMMGRI